MRSFPRAVRFIAVAVLAAAAMAQRENDRSWKWLEEWNPLEKGFRKDGDLFPAEYTVDKQGRLAIWPSPSAGGSTIAPERVYRLPGLQGMSWQSRLTVPVGYFAALFRRCSSLAWSHHLRWLISSKSEAAAAAGRNSALPCPATIDDSLPRNRATSHGLPTPPLTTSG